MRISRIGVFATLASLVCACTAIYSADVLKDEVFNLPGAPKLNFRQFSGYVPVNAEGTRKIFYWFVESQRNPATDPVVVWTNGGPGCSGLIGKFTEHGPFKPNKDGTLSLRSTSWNRLANFVYIEQPAGVGFSQPDKDFIYWGDDMAADDNLAFVRNFLKKFSNFTKNDLYISSESYGGHYVPQLALNIVKNAPELNFKGFLVGNPLTYLPYTDWGQFATFYYRGLIPRTEWDAYQYLGCQPDPNAPTPNPPPVRPSGCSSYENKFFGYAAGLDPYAIDFPVCTDAAAGRSERAMLRARMQHARAMLSARQQLDANSTSLLRSLPSANKLFFRTGSALTDYFPDYEPCVDSWASAYLNRADVQKAIHAEKPVFGAWSECANIMYSDDDQITAMMPIYRELIQRSQGKLKMLVFSGDDDTVCATPDSQLWIWNMGLDTVEAWRQWKHEGQVAGMTVGFKGLRFATIHGAGHMCPTTRPEQSFRAFQNFLNDKW